MLPIAVLSMLGAFDVTQFGAIANDNQPDDVAFQAALDAAFANKQRLHIPGGTFTLTQTWMFEEVWGLIVSGDGQRITHLEWKGDSQSPMIALRDSRAVTLEHFSIGAAPANPLDTAIWLENAPELVSIAPTGIVLRDLDIEGTSYANGVAGLNVGVRWAYGADANNDCTTLERVTVSNYLVAAYSIEHSQARRILFLHCSCNGLGPIDGVKLSQACVATNQGPDGRSGSFRWAWGGGGGHKMADFWLGDTGGPSKVAYGDFEGSNRLLLSSGPSGADLPIIIIGTRWSDSEASGDLKIVDFKFHGPLVLLGNNFGENWDVPITLYMNHGNAGSFLTLGNSIYSNAQDPVSGEPKIFSGYQPNLQAGNQLTDAEGVASRPLE